MELLNIGHYKHLQQLHKGWVKHTHESLHHARDPVWSNSIAVGSRGYVNSVQVALGISGKYKQITETNCSWVLREPMMPYT